MRVYIDVPYKQGVKFKLCYNLLADYKTYCKSGVVYILDDSMARDETVQENIGGYEREE